MDLIKVESLGDIRFGMPENVEEMNRPWAFYTFLGVPKDATLEQIRMAFKQKSRELHPDITGRQEGMKILNKIKSVLCDVGDPIGYQHSQRAHYDRVSSLDDYFAAFIDLGQERTKKFSEIIFERLGMEKFHAQLDQRLQEDSQEYRTLREEMEKSQDPAKRREREGQLSELRLEHYIMESEKLRPEQRQEARQKIDEIREKHRTKVRTSGRRFFERPRNYSEKVLDIFYLGGATAYFGQEKLEMGLASFEDGDKVLELIIGEVCKISGFKKVHFKSEKADVVITDPHLTGIVHVVEGSVTVDYSESSYGGVIRAGAPDVQVIEGFTKQGDLYIPTRFAEGDWASRTPALDIAVKQGAITLKVRSPKVARASRIIGESALREYISTHNIINEINISSYSENKKEYW